MSEHKKHHDSHKSEHVEKKSTSSLPPINGMIILMLVGMLIVGVLIGAVVAYGAGYTFGLNDGKITNISETQNVGQTLSAAKISEIEEKIQSFILGNSPEGSIPDGVSIAVDYNASAPMGSLGQFLIYFEAQGKKQLAGLAYASEDEFVFANSFPVELTSVDKVEAKPPVEVAKSEKPLVELFIWSYCPYGVTALDPYANVAKLLGDDTEFKVILYHDGHGAYETQQNKIQACVQKYDKAKFWDYAKAFASDIYPKINSIIKRDKDTYAILNMVEVVESDKTESVALMKSLKIDSTKIMSCVDTEGATLIAADSARAQSLGVTGSPTLTIDGAKASVARTAEAYKGAVCNAFLNAPADCDTVFSGQAATTSGSC